MLILVIALVVFGPNKLPELGKALGTGLREFKKATQAISDDVKQSVADDAREAARPQTERPAAKPPAPERDQA